MASNDGTLDDEQGLDTGSSDMEGGTSGEPVVRKRRAPRKSFATKITELLSHFKDARVSPFDLFMALVDESNIEYQMYRTELYKDSNTKLFSILNNVCENKTGQHKLRSWLGSPKGFHLFGNIIEGEMDTLRKDYALKGLDEITPEYIEHRDRDTFKDDAPFTMNLLLCAAQTKRQEEENIKKKPDQVCNAIMRQLLYQRSGRCIGFGAEFGLFLWANGASRSTIDAVHRFGLSVTYQSVLTNLNNLGKHCMKIAMDIASGPHCFCYDNVNLSTSEHVEQRGAFATPGKVTSGTLGILYRLENATPEGMALQPVLNRMRDPNYHGLDFSRDCTMTEKQLEDVGYEFRIHIIQILFKHFEQFNAVQYRTDPALKHKEQRPLPKNHRTKFYPIHLSTQEEASTGGNLKYHEEAYLKMLGQTEGGLSKCCILTINDQLTNARIRSGQVLRKDDLNNFSRRLVFQPGMGLFHAALNLAWAILSVHRGSVQQTSSLSYWFTLLHKVRLNGPKPDYHTLTSTLFQILEGVIYSAWEKICADEEITLKEYASSSPSPEDLHAKAEKILEEYLTPLPHPFTTTASADSDEDEPVNSTSSTIPPPASFIGQLDPTKDIAHQNLRLLIRDTLYLLELVSGVKDGDFGRIENILPHLAMIYRGAGSNNYCIETLFMIQNLKYIWTPDIANLMRDALIVNPSGIPGHFIATDANMEYTIRDVKSRIIVKGLQTTWDHASDISASITNIKELNRKMGAELELLRQNKGHSDVEVSRLVKKVVERVETAGLLTFMPNRTGNKNINMVPDLLKEGAKKMKSTSLPNFNDKFKKFVAGVVTEEEADDLPALDLIIEEED